MSTTRVKWARVEYQPNLKAPVKPIALGVIVLAGRGDSNEGVVLGREPRGVGTRPAELENVGALGLAQLFGWVDAVAAVARLAQREGRDAYEALCSRWCWNLYIAAPEELRYPKAQALIDVAQRVYKEHVGEAFRLSEVMRRKSPVKNRVHHARKWLPAEIGYAVPSASPSESRIDSLGG
jgi:hypothetical protein